MKKRILSAILAGICVLIFSFSVCAAAQVDVMLTSDVPLAPPGLRVVIDGLEYPGEAFLENGTTFVSLREFANHADVCVLSWSNPTQTASLWTKGLTLSVTAGAEYMEANERVLWCRTPSFIEEGTLFVPLRPLAEAFGYRCTYDDNTLTVTLTRVGDAIENGASFYAEDKLYWLSRIISAEACGEPFSGKLAVGAVIMNRVASSDYPDTIYGVIFDAEDGVQFTPTVNGAIYHTPSEDSVRAAKLILEGVLVDDDILFFLNEALAESKWIVNNRTYVTTIGVTDFYA